ncbi:hypothetical protein ACFQYP_49255 [Nonomuraea antimicrobica]
MLKRLVPALLVLPALLLTWAGPAAAHGRSGEADARFAQTIAGMELTVVVRASVRVPAPLQVDVVAHTPGPGGRVDLAIRSVEDGGSAAGAVRIEPGRPGMYPAMLSVDRVGPHELEVRAGGERSVLPLTVLVSSTPLWEVVVYAAFACAAVALIGAMAGALLSRRAVAGGFAGGFVVATVVAFTAGVLSPWFAPTPPRGAPPAPPQEATPLGRPNAQPLVEVEPGRPARGSEFLLRVRLFDGSTGHPVDDLVEHHAALSHVVVTSQDGSYFRHVHPAHGAGDVRVAAARAGGGSVPGVRRVRTDRRGRATRHRRLHRRRPGGRRRRGRGGDAAGRERGRPGRRARAAGGRHPRTHHARHRRHRPAAVARHGRAPHRPEQGRRLPRPRPRGRLDDVRLRAAA